MKGLPCLAPASVDHVLFPVLALFVILPLFRFVQGPGADALRTVDFLSIYASGVALGALSATIGRWVPRRADPR